MKKTIFTALTMIALSLSMQAQAFVTTMSIDGLTTNYLYLMEAEAAVKKRYSFSIKRITRTSKTTADVKGIRKDGELILIHVKLK